MCMCRFTFGKSNYSLNKSVFFFEYLRIVLVENFYMHFDSYKNVQLVVNIQLDHKGFPIHEKDIV